VFSLILLLVVGCLVVVVISPYPRPLTPGKPPWPLLWEGVVAGIIWLCIKYLLPGSRLKYVNNTRHAELYDYEARGQFH